MGNLLAVAIDTSDTAGPPPAGTSGCARPSSVRFCCRCNATEGQRRPSLIHTYIKAWNVATKPGIPAFTQPYRWETKQKTGAPAVPSLALHPHQSYVVLLVYGVCVRCATSTNPNHLEDHIPFAMAKDGLLQQLSLQCHMCIEPPGYRSPAVVTSPTLRPPYPLPFLDSSRVHPDQAGGRAMPIPTGRDSPRNLQSATPTCRLCYEIFVLNGHSASLPIQVCAAAAATRLAASLQQAQEAPSRGGGAIPGADAVLAAYFAPLRGFAAPNPDGLLFVSAGGQHPKNPSPIQKTRRIPPTWRTNALIRHFCFFQQRQQEGLAAARLAALSVPLGGVKLPPPGPAPVVTISPRSIAKAIAATSPTVAALAVSPRGVRSVLPRWGGAARPSPRQRAGDASPPPWTGNSPLRDRAAAAPAPVSEKRLVPALRLDTVLSAQQKQGATAIATQQKQRSIEPPAEAAAASSSEQDVHPHNTPTDQEHCSRSTGHTGGAATASVAAATTLSRHHNRSRSPRVGSADGRSMESMLEIPGSPAKRPCCCWRADQPTIAAAPAAPSVEEEDTIMRPQAFGEEEHPPLPNELSDVATIDHDGDVAPVSSEPIPAPRAGPTGTAAAASEATASPRQYQSRGLHIAAPPLKLASLLGRKAKDGVVPPKLDLSAATLAFPADATRRQSGGQQQQPLEAVPTFSSSGSRLDTLSSDRHRDRRTSDNSLIGDRRGPPDGLPPVPLPLRRPSQKQHTPPLPRLSLSGLGKLEHPHCHHNHQHHHPHYHMPPLQQPKDGGPPSSISEETRRGNTSHRGGTGRSFRDLTGRSESTGGLMTSGRLGPMSGASPLLLTPAGHSSSMASSSDTPLYSPPPFAGGERGGGAAGGGMLSPTSRRIIEQRHRDLVRHQCQEILNRPPVGDDGSSDDLDSRGSTTPATTKEALLTKYRSICTEVVPAGRLYISGAPVAQSHRLLQQAGITHIVNMAGDTCKNYFPNSYRYVTYVLQDTRLSSAEVQAILLGTLDYIASILAQSERHRVLIHCREGVSRSATVVVAYLMWTAGIPFRDALDILRASRPMCNPNTGFTYALLRFEKSLDLAGTRRDMAVPASSSVAEHGSEQEQDLVAARPQSSAVAAGGGGSPRHVVAASYSSPLFSPREDVQNVVPPPPPSLSGPIRERKLLRICAHDAKAPFLVALPMSTYEPRQRAWMPPIVALDPRFYYILRNNEQIYLWRGSEVIHRRLTETFFVTEYLRSLRQFEGPTFCGAPWNVIYVRQSEEPPAFWDMLVESAGGSGGSDVPPAAAAAAAECHDEHRRRMISRPNPLDASFQVLQQQEVLNFAEYVERLHSGRHAWFNLYGPPALPSSSMSSTRRPPSSPSSSSRVPPPTLNTQIPPPCGGPGIACSSQHRLRSCLLPGVAKVCSLQQLPSHSSV